MKIVFFLALLLSITSQAKASSAVESSYAVKIGQKGEATLYWQHKSIRKKDVFVTGYRGTRGLASEQVIPKSEFLKQVKELKDWRKTIVLKQSALGVPSCNELVVFNANHGLTPLCLADLPKENKVSFLRWYKKQTDFVAGRM